MRNKIFLIFLAFFLSFPLLAQTKGDIPEVLQPWKDWVLHGAQESLCPTPYNNGDEHVCVWQTNLKLQLNEQSGQFTLTAMNYVDGWVRLPGDNEGWPEQVKINDKLIPVETHQGGPAAYLPQGEYTIQGQFTWDKLPDYVQIPPNTGTVTLTLNAKPIVQPERNADGKIWLRQQLDQNLSEKEDTLSFKVYRLIQDHIPQTDNTLIRLKATGQIREAFIGPVLQPDTLPLQVQSDLPAKLEENGMLRLQIKPGFWEIKIRSRFLSKQDKFSLQKHLAPWPQDEIWAFQPYNDLRLVEVEGALSIDPQQTDMPEAWKTLPTYLMKSDTNLVIVEKRRGQEKRSEELQLQRKLWLDFSGKGYITQDTLIGSAQNTSRLRMAPPYILSSAAIDGQNKLITQLDDNDPPGIEIRQGQLNLTGVSRILGRPFHLPAIGWDVDVKSLSSTLILPPGWMLLGAWGVDSVTNAWIQEWTLLDLFLVLIMAAATAKLLGIRWGVLALVTLTLIYRERGAPIYSWLNLIAALGLLKVLPMGNARTWILYYSRLSLVVLVLIALPFMVKQIREAIYPQLTVPNSSPVALMAKQQRYAVQGMVALPASPRAAMESMAGGAGASKAMLGGNLSEMKDQAPPLVDYDPNAKIQTGPGIPAWYWDEFQLNWNGPVLKDQKLTLWILSSSVTSCLKILQVVLMILLMYALSILWRQNEPFITNMKRSLPSSSTTLSLFMALIFAATSLVGIMPSNAYADFPSQELLGELKDRLLEPAHCLPECADISRLVVQTTPDQLTLKLTIHAAVKTAIPLPSSIDKWMPQSVTVDGVAAKYLQLEKQQLWVQLEQGVHEVVLEGAVGKQDKFDVIVPLKPKVVESHTEGWTVDGVFRHQLQGESLYFTRVKSAQIAASNASSFTPGQMPTYVVLTRTLKLGFDWEIFNELRRDAPLQGAINVQIPLVQGESILSDNVEVKDAKVFVSMGENQRSISWKSKLKQMPEIKLIAPTQNNIKEIWQLDAISQWHCRFEGIPIIHQQNPQGRWFPTWYPWPGETLTISVTRPVAVAGETFTIENSRLTIVPGKRATDNTLNFLARSSLGGTHSLKIPQEAKLQDVLINGMSQPLNARKGEITIPIHPGEQQIELKWQLPEGIRNYYATPTADLNQSSSNTLINLQLGKDRWILALGGPAVGPAVLFWGILIVVVLVAIMLGKFAKTPLTTWQWLLLGVGIAVATPLAALIVVAWFFAMRKRGEATIAMSEFSFQVIQVGLSLLTLLFVVSLFTSISSGLLGTPQMQLGTPYVDFVQSIFSFPTYFQLQWYQDISSRELPHAWVVSLPLYVYRILMLLWALWLAFSLIRWLRWGWQCFSTGGLWYRQPPQ
ncbi:MAG: hypothetical protein J0H47_12750 [Gammaproteobacteria bacterium]|nr:hypothetical protein [Gammaproteobacteria bacterium]